MACSKCGSGNCCCNTDFGCCIADTYVEEQNFVIVETKGDGSSVKHETTLPAALGDGFGGQPIVTQDLTEGNITVTDSLGAFFVLQAAQICLAMERGCPNGFGGDGLGTNATFTVNETSGAITLSNDEGDAPFITAAMICTAVAAGCPASGAGDGFGTDLQVTSSPTTGSITLSNGEGQAMVIPAQMVCDAIAIQCPTAGGGDAFGGDPLVTQNGVSGDITVTDSQSNSFDITAAQICTAVAQACPGAGGGDGFGTNPTVAQNVGTGLITLSNDEGQSLEITAAQICTSVNVACGSSITDNGGDSYNITGTDGSAETVAISRNTLLSFNSGNNILTLTQSNGAAVQEDLSVLAVNDFGGDPVVTENTGTITVTDFGGSNSFDLTPAQICAAVSQGCPGGASGDGFGTNPASQKAALDAGIELVNDEGQTITIAGTDLCDVIAATCPGGGNTSIMTDNTAGNGLDDGTIVHQDGMGTTVTIDICAATQACIDPVQTAADTDFVDDENPTLLEAQSLATALPNGGPTYIQYTSPAGKEWRWFVDKAKTAVLAMEPPLFRYKAEMGKFDAVVPDPSPTNQTPLSLTADATITAGRMYLDTVSDAPVTVQFYTRPVGGGALAPLGNPQTIAAGQASVAIDNSVVTQVISAGDTIADEVTFGNGTGRDLNIVLEAQAR